MRKSSLGQRIRSVPLIIVVGPQLAYQYTRPAPNKTKPRPNVIVRLCSIECNFLRPLTDPSNAAFTTDIVNWNKISDRLYIWDYVVDFHAWLMPWPNYFVLAPNIRFFRDHGVKGIFEEGNYKSYGGDLEAMKCAAAPAI